MAYYYPYPGYWPSFSPMPYPSGGAYVWIPPPPNPYPAVNALLQPSKSASTPESPQTMTKKEVDSKIEIPITTVPTPAPTTVDAATQTEPPQRPAMVNSVWIRQSGTAYLYYNGVRYYPQRETVFSDAGPRNSLVAVSTVELGGKLLVTCNGNTYVFVRVK